MDLEADAGAVFLTGGVEQAAQRTDDVAVAADDAPDVLFGVQVFGKYEFFLVQVADPDPGSAQEAAKVLVDTILAEDMRPIMDCEALDKAEDNLDAQWEATVVAAKRRWQSVEADPEATEDERFMARLEFERENENWREWSIARHIGGINQDRLHLLKGRVGFEGSPTPKVFLVAPVSSGCSPRYVRPGWKFVAAGATLGCLGGLGLGLLCSKPIGTGRLHPAQPC